MGRKFGLHVTTSVLAFAALSGCAPKAADMVSQDGPFDPIFSSNDAFDCQGETAICGFQELALLKEPDNVVYTTRAGVTILSHERGQVPMSDTPAASADGSVDPQEDADRGE